MRVFTRTLDDITARLPEVVAPLAGAAGRDAVLDGEAIALRAGRAAAPVSGDGRRGPPGAPAAALAAAAFRSTCCTSTART